MPSTGGEHHALSAHDDHVAIEKDTDELVTHDPCPIHQVTNGWRAKARHPLLQDNTTSATLQPPVPSCPLPHPA